MRDNSSFADEKDIEDERWIRSRPICHECGEHIQEEFLYDFDGVLFCQNCIEEHKQEVEYYED